jgi:TonB family protein
MLPETMESPEILERVQAEINAAMKDVDLPAAVDPSARVVNPLPDAPKVTPVSQPEEAQAAAAAAVAETKARVQGGVMKIVDDTAVPEPMDLSSPPEHLDVAAVPPSTSSAPPLSSEIKLLLDGLVAGQNRGDEQGSKGSDEYAQWTDRVRLIIDRNWYSPPKVELSVLVGFRISSDGRVGQVVIKESSGNHVFDKAAMRAVKQSKRLPPFPAEIQKEFLDVVYKFSKIPEGAKRS